MSFPLLFERWQQAEQAALGAERRLSRQLDAYCEGWGQAPSVADVSATQTLRARARGLLRAVQQELASQRDGAPVL